MTSPAPAPPTASGTPPAAPPPPSQTTPSSADPAANTPPGGASAAGTGPLHSQLKTPGFAWPLAAIGLFLAGIFCTLWFTGQSLPHLSALDSPETRAAQNIARETEAANRKLQQAALDNSALGSEEEAALASQKWKELKRSLDRARKSVRELQVASTRWAARRTALLTSDEGKRLGGDPQAVQQFSALADKPLRDPLELTAWNDDLQEIDELVTQALSSKVLTIEPKEALSERVRKIHSSAETALRSQQADDEALALLFELARAEPRADAPTLAALLDQAKNLRAKERLEKLTEELEKVRKEGAALDRQSQTLYEKQKLDIERELKETDQAADLLRKRNDLSISSERTKELEKSIAADRIKRERIRKFEADLPEIKRLLSPVISVGQMQIGKSGWQPVQQPQPVSYSALVSSGLLKPSSNASLLLMEGIGRSSRNDRPLGAFPSNIDDKAAARFQYLLTEYGDILVERKMLLP